MPRHKEKIRPTRLTTTIPEDLREKLDNYLKKIGGGVIQEGAYKKFFAERIREFFKLGD